MTPDRRAVSFVVAATALAMVGCDTRNEQTSAAGATDCRLSPSPAVSIGGLEPPAHIFGDASDVGRLPNGNIAVADRIARTVTVFDTAGELVPSRSAAVVRTNRRRANLAGRRSDRRTRRRAR